MIILACFMVEVFVFGGSMIGGFLLAILSMPFVIANLNNLDAVLQVFNHLYVQLGIFAFIALALFAWVKWYEKRPISSLGFFKTNVLLEILKGWGVGMLVFSFAFGSSYLFGGLDFNRVDFSGENLLFVLSTIPFWFIQGGTEELLTRAWLLPIVNKRSNLAIAIGISSSLFGIMHLANNHVTALSILSIVLSGVFMALYMLKTDNIWGVAGLHGAWNFTQGNIFGVAVSGTSTGSSLFSFAIKPEAADWISGGAFETEGSLMASIALLLGIAYLGFQLKKEKELHAH
ncbi:CPBP family intramembrane metalloprotease [Streptococcus sp. 121]|uniref:CPBP family intramembrane glutamic endopeptidase n=1 Tax=Streptococcus sp. 121 TaxID=2797637 RepID=UPI0018F08C77|nr:type II CAAX endopeptidase family protein [Streptococcus sp. 121]MBJ6746580.1 CPBP family intramembrane metalloprotease [Streptococcus sp. 121]